MKTTIVLATGNAGKVAEFLALVQYLPIELKTSKEIGYTQEIEETGSSFAENAALKAEALSEFTNMWAIADDSGVVVPFLLGEPGIYSARYAGENATDEDNNQHLLDRLQQAEGREREACFVSEIALARPGYATEFFRGECWGSILREPLGQGGFGYDPLFWVPNFEQTYAQLPLTVKNKISHRGKAMEKCARRLAELLRN